MNDIGYVWGRIVRCTVGGVLVLGMLILAEIAFAKEQTPTTLREMLEAKDPKILNQAINSALQDRLRLVHTLIKVVDQANAGGSSKKAGNAGAFLLGKLRAPEAVPVLSRALAKVDPNDLISSDIDPLKNAAFHALVQIGRPSVPAMITNITTSGDESLRRRSMAVIYLVLGGRDNLIELVNRLMEQKERSGEEKDRLAQALEWAQSQYKDDIKPLF